MTQAEWNNLKINDYISMGTYVYKIKRCYIKNEIIKYNVISINGGLPVVTQNKNLWKKLTDLDKVKLL